MKNVKDSLLYDDLIFLGIVKRRGKCLTFNFYLEVYDEKKDLTQDYFVQYALMEGFKSNLNTKKVGDYIVLYKLDNKYYLFRKVSVIDDVKPEINLLGEEEMIIDYGSNYKEPYFTATDNYDGDITKNVKYS